MPLPAIAPSGVSTAFLYPNQVSAGAGVSPIISADPGNTNPPIIFEPPCLLTNNQLLVWIVATGGLNWGGCQVQVSVDNISYVPIGTIVRGAIQGLLTSTFPSGSDPDTTNTLQVDVTESQAQILAGTVTDADDFLTLCYVDGELVSYSAATLTSAFHYDFGTYLRRGCYGTTVGSHASGSKFARLVASTFSQTFPPNLIGKLIYFKFPSFNLFGGGFQDVSTLSPYTYTLTGVGQCPTGGPLLCPVDVGLAAGCNEDWGVLGECLSSTCDWGTLGTPVQLCLDMGVIGL